MDKPLKGIYRISFELDVDSVDQISVSDVAQSLLEGFGEGLLECVSHLDVQKIEKHGEIDSGNILKIGDMVQLKEGIKIKANIYSDDGYLFTGQPTEISEVEFSDCIISIEAGSFGYVNKITEGNKVEIVDLDKPVLLGSEQINVDSLIVNATQLDKIETGENK